MAVTRLSDLTINPTAFSDGVILDSLNLDALVQSGAVIRDPSLDAFLASSNGGPTVTVRQLKPLEAVDANVSSDDPAVSAVPRSVGSLKTIAVRQSLNAAWSEMDLAVDLYGSDPIGQLQNQITKYWTSVRQLRLLATIHGMVADSHDNHGGDLVLDVAPVYKAPEDLGPEDFISAGAIIDAAALMGDRASNLAGLAVHSVVYATMAKLNLIEFRRFSESSIEVPAFLGFPVIQDDNLTIITKPADAEEEFPAYDCYCSYLFGYGAFSLGLGSPKTPWEVDRIPLAGNGGGQETVISRIEMVLHPQGYQTNLTETPTIAQLKDLASWIRVWERKRIPLSVLITRG